MAKKIEMSDNWTSTANTFAVINKVKLPATNVKKKANKHKSKKDSE
ncbi:MAG: hypothetical protein Q4A45_04960 [Clostridia bacterium]|nr:hypothetical protein [Clostridia bacterium]